MHNGAKRHTVVKRIIDQPVWKLTAQELSILYAVQIIQPSTRLPQPGNGHVDAFGRCTIPSKQGRMGQILRALPRIQR